MRRTIVQPVRKLLDVGAVGDGHPCPVHPAVRIVPENAFAWNQRERERERESARARDREIERAGERARMRERERERKREIAKDRCSEQACAGVQRHGQVHWG